MLEREEKTTRDCNVLSLIKVFEKATSLGKREGWQLLGCNAEWLSPVVLMAPELTEELLVHQILARSGLGRAGSGLGEGRHGG